jgi:hypothetical protein
MKTKGKCAVYKILRNYRLINNEINVQGKVAKDSL